MCVPGVVSVERIQVAFSQVMGEWGNPPLSGQQMMAVACHIKKGTDHKYSEKMYSPSTGPLVFQPPCQQSRIGRPELDALSMEGHPLLPVCEKQLPTDLLRYV